MRTKLKLVLFFSALAVNISAQSVQHIYTTASERWVNANLTIDQTKEAVDLFVYPDSTLQLIDGVGGSFNELGWTAINSLPKDQSKEVFEALFSKNGCNFSMCRMPLGASDYALSYYSSNDVPEDFVMRDFNIDRDKFILIPYIKEALKVRPDLLIWASPWTPPAWMKINEHYSTRSGDWNGRPDGNRMTQGAEVFNNATAFKMQERYLKAYALYFSKFVQAYQKEGINLFAIMPQNEIAYSPNWPSCTWRAEDLSYFIGSFLGPQFEQDSLDTQIWLGTINWSRPSYTRTILDDEKTAKHLKGVGYQWGGANAIKSIHKEYPSYKYMQTENKCGEGENDWSSLDSSWETMVHYFNNGVGSYMYWNMVLDETGKSSWGWPQNSMIVINREEQKINYTDEFYLFKHLSHFVQPGDYFLKSSNGKNHLAFQLKSGQVLVLINNPESEENLITLQVGDHKITAELKPKSINSIVIN
ncbi:MAG: glycoside hydrolase family 30 protein [Saprospiraceae bacterium]